MTSVGESVRIQATSSDDVDIGLRAMTMADVDVRMIGPQCEDVDDMSDATSSTTPITGAPKWEGTNMDGNPSMMAGEDEDKAMFSGYLRKRYSSSLYMGSWRYCVVYGNRLRWYMTEAMAQADTQMRGEVFVKSVEPWNGRGSMNLYPHAFAIRTTNNRVLLCSAKSDEEKALWVQTFQKGATYAKELRLSRRRTTFHHDGLSLSHAHGPESAERRRIVPEDAVRAAALSDISSFHGSMIGPSSSFSVSTSAAAPPYTGDSFVGSSFVGSIMNDDGKPSFTTRPDRTPSFVSSISDSETSVMGNGTTECARCAVRFGTFVARRVVCASCDRAFCSRHCNRPVKLHHLDVRAPTRKCCTRCARRQHFLVYLGTVSDFMGTLARSPRGITGLVERSHPEDPEQFSRTVLKLRRAPMSLIKTIKILYQTRQKPQLFCVACERLPFYVENCIDRVENLWYQILHLFQCCDTELDTFSVQLFCLKRYIRAICRRSPRIALQTIWHVQAAMEDASRHHPNSLLSLLGFLYPPTSVPSPSPLSQQTHSIWTDLLLADCPVHQRAPICSLLMEIHAKSSQLIASEPDSMTERWLRAQTVREFETAAMELGRSGISLCEYQSAIQYRSLAIESDDTRTTHHLEELVTEQVRFVQALAAISERLRHVQPVENRSKHLSDELQALDGRSMGSALYPLCTASDELYKVLRIPPNEGKVFSTKMRAPTLIFIETVPVDASNLLDGDDRGTAERLMPFLCSSQRGNLSFLDDTLLRSDVEEVVTLGPHRESLTSSTESSTGTTPIAKKRHGSQLSCAEDLDTISNMDDIEQDETVTATTAPNGSTTETVATTTTTTTGTSQSSMMSGLLLNRHLTFPRDSSHGRPESIPSSGFSLTNLTHALPRQQHAMDNIVYDSKVYGESWEERKERIRRESPHGHLTGWRLFSIIVKTNDDLRQEMFTMQLVNKFKSIFEFEGLDLWLRTYRIVATGANIGLLETINDACSLDHLKKNFTGGNLFAYFKATYGEPETSGYEMARGQFIRSLAAYSILSYVLLVKDRHNGNILLSSEGHIIHIDFGFILGIAPGGMFSIEDAPFKLTEEMVEIMGGLGSSGFARYRKALIDGFSALQKYQSEIVALLQTTGQHSPFPCFEGARLSRVVTDMRARLCVDLSARQVEKRVDYLIKKSYNAWGTRQYDAFQLRSNNIHP